MTELKTEYGGQACKEEDEIDQMIHSATRLIESVYRDIQQYAPRGGTPQTSHQISQTQQTTPTRRSPRSSNSFATTSPKTPPNRHHVLSPSSHEIELEVERINRFVETVDHNLRTIGPQTRLRSSQSSAHCRCSQTSSLQDVAFLDQVENNTPEAVRGATLEPMSTPLAAPSRRRNPPLNAVTATPEAIIDLSETQSPSLHSLASAFNYALDDDDDVIIVSSNLNDVVDLCTSVSQYATPPRHLSSTLSRRGAVSGGVSGSGSTSSSYRSRSPLRAARGVEVQTSTTNIFENLPQPPPNRVSQSKSDSIAAADSGANVNVAAGSGGRAPFMCPVCMDSTLKNKPTSTKCGHVFCGPCIREAIRLNHKCPMCNTKLKPNMLFRIYL